MCTHTKNIWRKNKPIAFGNANKTKQTKAFINAPKQVRKLSTQQTKSHKKKQPQANKTKLMIHKKKHKTHQKIIKDKLTKRSRPTGLIQTQRKSMHNHHIANTKESCKHTKKHKTKENTSKTLKNANNKKTTFKINKTKTSINYQLTHTTNIDPQNINKQWYKTCEVEKPHYITQTRHHTITLKTPTQ